MYAIVITALLCLGWLAAAYFTGVVAEHAWGDEFVHGDTASYLFLFWPLYLVLALGSLWVSKKEAVK